MTSRKDRDDGGARVALVTAIEARDLDEDMPILCAAFDATAGDPVATVEAWDDPDVDWGSYQLVVIRSTWDYTLRLEEFLAWTDRVGGLTEVRQAPDVIRWNVDKRYLADLERLGIPIVPSRFFAPGDEVEVPTDGECVVKPTVSAGSRDTARYSAARRDDARTHATALLAAGRGVLVQPYQGSVDSQGEIGVICVAGAVSHAITKGALLELDGDASRSLFVPERIEARTLAADERAAVSAVLGALPSVPGIGSQLSPPLYARVDLLRAADGELRLLELELIEPSLFLDRAEGAAAAFVTAIRELLASEPFTPSGVDGS